MRSTINTAKYSALQSLYWIAFCLVICYMTVYLLDLGFSSTRIGVLLAVSNLISALAQQIVGALCDRFRKARLELIVAGGLFIASVAALVLYLSGTSVVMVSLMTVVLMVSGFTIAPTLNSMAFQATERYVNYGFARGIGSLSYALTSVVAGYVFENVSTRYIPLTYTVAFALGALAAIGARQPKDVQQLSQQEEDGQTESKGFVRSHLRELLLLFGACMIFFDHMMINNFLKQLTLDIGGTTSQMGIAIFIAAAVEFPVMLLFTRIKAKISCAHLLRIAAVMFVAKHALTFIAVNMTMLYIASALQICSYALFITALLYYFTQVMSGRELGKGQALANSVITVSSIFASASGGLMIDSIGVRATLGVGLALSVIGAFVVWFTVRVHKKA